MINYHGINIKIRMRNMCLVAAQNLRVCLVLLAGQGGIGKSTALRHLALSWANGTVNELKQFDFVFHIALKDVKNDQSIENIIIKQHKGLKSRKVSPIEIKNIIESDQHKILLLLDGHDEYTVGTNPNIDDVITKDILTDCSIILTSRESKELPEIRCYMDAEAEITGFDSDGIREYITKYLGSREKQKELISHAKKCKLITSDFRKDDGENDDSDDTEEANQDDLYDFGILCIPLLLHMICVLYLRKVSLPRTRTGIISAIVERCPDWEEIRKTGQKRVKAVEEALVRLGQYVLKRLLDGDKSQVFKKV